MAIVHLNNLRSFEAAPGRPLLDAAASAGLALEHSCRTGRCGSCRAKVTRGQAEVLREAGGLSPDEARDGWILTCASAAASDDLALDLDDLGALAGIAVKTLPARIDTLERVAPDVLRVRLRLPPNARLRWLAGQSLDVIGPGGVRRSYSLANAEGAPELLIRRVPGGRFSQYWFEHARPGDLLRFEGPRGTFHLRDVTGLDVVMLATGTGIAPLVAMLQELAARPAQAQPRSLHLLWGNRRGEDLFLLPAAPALRYTPVLSRADTHWAGARGHVQDVLLAHAPAGLAPRVVYACGSTAMIDAARRAVPAHRFYSDAFVASHP